MQVATLQAPMRPVPLDVVDLIIEHLSFPHLCLFALKACSLVCTSWVAPAQKRIFYNIGFNVDVQRKEHDAANCLSELLYLFRTTSPHLSSYVRSFTICSRSLPKPHSKPYGIYLIRSGDLYTLLQHFHRIRELHIQVDNKLTELPHGFIQAMIDLMSRCKCERITLKTSPFSATGIELAKFLRPCADSLKHLCVGPCKHEGSYGGSDALLTCSDPVLDLKGLETLQFRWHTPYSLGRAIWPSKLHSFSQHLRFSGETTPSIPPVGVPSSVTAMDFTVSFYYLMPPHTTFKAPVFNGCTNLQRLTLCASLYRESQLTVILLALGAFFENASSENIPRLEHVTFRVYFGKDDSRFDWDRFRAWDPMDAKLAFLVDMGALKRVVVDVVLSAVHRRMAALMGPSIAELQFPRLREKGVLSVTCRC